MGKESNHYFTDLKIILHGIHYLQWDPHVEPAKLVEGEETESESSDSQEEQGRNGDCIYFGWDFTPLYCHICCLARQYFFVAPECFSPLGAIAGHQHLHTTGVDHGHVRNTDGWYLGLVDYSFNLLGRCPSLGKGRFSANFFGFYRGFHHQGIFNCISLVNAFKRVVC